MTQSIIDQLLKIKEQLIEWPKSSYQNKNDRNITSDDAFKLIEADLRIILDKILLLSDEEKKSLRRIIDDFRNIMMEKQRESEENIIKPKEQVDFNKSTPKAMKTYGKTTSSHSDLEKNEN